MRFVELDEQNQGAVRELILRGLVEHWGAPEEGLNPDLDDMLATYEAGRTIVAVEGDDVVGTGTVVPRGEGIAEIVRMSVAPESRRSGLGRSIVEELVSTAAGWGASAVVLETSSNWVEVVDFYRSCGFEITHTEVGEFGEDTWFERRI